MSNQPNEEAALEKLLGQMAEMGGAPDMTVEAIPTGIASFDVSTGIGGVPRRRIAIFQGEEHSGKTLLLLKTIAAAQAAGGRCAFIDAEHALTPSFAQLLGVDWDALVPYVSRPQTLDQAYDILRLQAKSGLFDVIGFDSVTALTTKAAIDSPAGEAASRAAVARMHSEELPKLAATLNKRTSVIFINQMRENPNPPQWARGKVLYTPGGKALRHYSSMTVEIKSGEVYKKGDMRVGHRLKTHIIKNKVGTPYQRSEFDLMYDSGLDLTSNLVDEGIRVGAVRQSGSWFYVAMVDLETGEALGDERKFAGRDKLQDALKEEPDFLEYLTNMIAQVSSSED